MPSRDLDEDIVGPIVRSLITNDMSDVERAEVLHDWIVENIDFGYETLMRAEDPYRLRSTRECLEQHEGNCIEQSLMWLTMAEVVGIKRPYLVISYGAPSALIAIAAVGGGDTGITRWLIRTMLTLVLRPIMWYEQRTRRQSPGDRHYFNAVRDDDGHIHAFDISYRMKGALPVLRTNWTFLEPKDAPNITTDPDTGDITVIAPDGTTTTISGSTMPWTKQSVTTTTTTNDKELKQVLQWLEDHLGLVIGIGAAVLILIIGMTALLQWLGSRGKFMFLEPRPGGASLG